MDIKIRIEYREAQNYAAIRKQVSFQQIPKELPQLIPEIKNWLAGKNMKPAGPLFFNYLAMNGSQFDVEVGFPVDVKFEDEARVKAGEFEAGNYLVATYFGPYQHLHEVHAALQKWAGENQVHISGPGTEYYVTDPATEPDENKWQTDIVAQIPQNEADKITPEKIVADKA